MLYTLYQMPYKIPSNCLEATLLYSPSTQTSFFHSFHFYWTSVQSQETRFPNFISNLQQQQNLTSATKCSFILTMEGSLADKIELPALYLSKTYCHKGVQDPLAVNLLDNQLFIF